MGGAPLSWGLLSKLSCFSGKEGRLSDSGQGPSWTGFLQHVCQAVVPAYNPRDAGREEIHLVWFIIHRPLSLRIKGPAPWAASWTTAAFALHLWSDPPLQLSVSSGVLRVSFLSPKSFHPPDKKPMKAVLKLQPLCLSSETSVPAAARAAGSCCLSLRPLSSPHLQLGCTPPEDCGWASGPSARNEHEPQTIPTWPSPAFS